MSKNNRINDCSKTPPQINVVEQTHIGIEHHSAVYNTITRNTLAQHELSIDLRRPSVETHTSYGSIERSVTPGSPRVWANNVLSPPKIWPDECSSPNVLPNKVTQLSKIDQFTAIKKVQRESLIQWAEISLDGGGSIASGPNDFMMANYVSGMQLYGRMSAVRRFFILFVTFDLLFISLFWLICVLVNGFDEETNIFKALLKQIVEYNIYESMFDLVMCAAARFFLLILFYSCIHINHWWLVAITTAGSCVFLIAKTLVYHWKKTQEFYFEPEYLTTTTKSSDKKLDSSYPFEVMLILISFLIAWAEAWFVDFRVLPQEARARSIVDAATNSDRITTDNEDTVGHNIERVRDYLSHYTESVANFYSPLESPAGSDDEDFDGRRISRKLSPQDLAVISTGVEALQKSLEVLRSGGWKLEKETSHGDTVHSKLGPRGTKIYMVQGIVDAVPEVLFNETLQNFEKIPTWNKSLSKCELIQKIDSNTDVIYQVAAEGPGGIVSARDFVNVRHWKKVEDSWVSAGIAIVHPEMPAKKKLVRGENGPGCWSFGPVENSPKKCQFRFLLDTDLKGWIPQYVLDQALTHTCTEFMAALRVLAATLNQR